MTDANVGELQRLQSLMRDPRYWQKKDRIVRRSVVLEQQMRQPQFRGGGSSSPNPKRRNPFLDHQDEPLL